MALRTVTVLALLMWVPSTEALLAPPVTCYILDGFLLLYCIIFTALFFKLKLKSENNSNEASNTGGGEDRTYEELPPAGPSSGAVPKRRPGATEGTYQTLQSNQPEGAYQVIEATKTKGRTKSKEPSQPEAE